MQVIIPGKRLAGAVHQPSRRKRVEVKANRTYAPRNGGANSAEEDQALAVEIREWQIWEEIRE